jgi:hypothetical protein
VPYSSGKVHTDTGSPKYCPTPTPTPTPPALDCLGHPKSLGHSLAECQTPPQLDCLGHPVSLGHSLAECQTPPQLDCLGHNKSLGHSDAECPKPSCVPTVANQHCGTDVPDCVATGGCGGTTTGGGGTTTGGGGTTTGGGGGSTTGLGGGSTGAAQGTTGTTITPPKCPTLTGGTAGAVSGPMPKGCAVAIAGGGGDPAAIPFTGLETGALLGLASLVVGLGLGFIVLGAAKRRRTS